jgi:hypothetical protein
VVSDGFFEYGATSSRLAFTAREGTAANTELALLDETVV